MTINEPVGLTNPVKLIIKVIDFGRRHKQPVTSSAFAYGDLASSRLDLGKERYGGPFTTEVEDVKTFWTYFLNVIDIIRSIYIFLNSYWPCLYNMYLILSHYRCCVSHKKVHETLDYILVK